MGTKDKNLIIENSNNVNVNLHISQFVIANCLYLQLT